MPHVPPQAALLATIALPAAAWIALARFDPSPAPDRCSPPLPRGRRTAPVVRMGLFIMFFSFVAGLSYQIIVVAPLSPYADDSLRLLPYILGVLVCGALADGRNLKTPLVGGASLLALAFLIGAWTQPIAQYAGLGLNGVAFGLLEATPWLLLAANATPDTAGRWFGWGLNLNIVPIFFGAAASAAIQGLDPPHAGLLAAVALILAVASLHGVEDPLAELHHQAPAPVIHGTSATFDHLLDRRYGDVLSQREAEVGRLAVLGVESSEIARRLYISENTVKTHLRHVYRKTASTGRSDLLRKLVAPGGQRE